MLLLLQTQAASVHAAADGIISAAAAFCANRQTATERVWQRCLELHAGINETTS